MLETKIPPSLPFSNDFVYNYLLENSFNKLIPGTKYEVRDL